MSWFRCEADMVDHPKVFQLAEVLRNPCAGWYYVRLLAWTSRYAARGRLADGARTSIEHACGWRGETGELLAAFVRVGLVDELKDQDDGATLEIHDWWELQRQYVVKAEKDAERKRTERAGRTGGARTSNGRSNGRSNGPSLDSREMSAVTAHVRDETRRDETEKQHLSTSVDRAPIGFSLELVEPTPTPHKAPSERLEDQLSDSGWQVWEHWRQTLKHPRAKLDKARKRVIEDRLKDYSVADLQLAIDGCAKSPWHQGANDRSRRYDELTLILRDAEHVERFLEAARG